MLKEVTATSFQILSHQTWQCSILLIG